MNYIYNAWSSGPTVTNFIQVNIYSASSLSLFLPQFHALFLWGFELRTEFSDFKIVYKFRWQHCQVAIKGFLKNKLFIFEPVIKYCHHTYWMGYWIQSILIFVKTMAQYPGFCNMDYLTNTDRLGPGVLLIPDLLSLYSYLSLLGK